MESAFGEWDNYARKKALKPRETDLESILRDSKLKIVAITGIRRCGKSSLLMLLRQKLESEGKRAAYVNLEDSRIKNDKGVLDGILKWFGDSDEGWLLLDEITAVEDWEGWLARNHEMLKGNLRLIVSSSRRNLAVPNKPLRGRILPHELYPLSFREFLEFKGIEVENTTVGVGRIEKALEEYLIYGGFPEVVIANDKTDKVRLLNSYFKDIIGLDVAEVSKEEVSTVELFGKYVIEATRFSASKCLNFFKSAGYKIGKQSLLNLEKYAQGSYLFFFVPIFSFNIKDRAQYSRKAYLGDTGFLYSMSGRADKGKLYENAVFLELKRRATQTEEISYWKNPEGAETDFVLREGLKAKMLIQSVYELDGEETKKREIKGIAACAKEFGFGEGLIIAKDAEKTETHDGIKIKFVPLWKWLIGKGE